MHERLDIERWKAEFPLSRLRAKAREFVIARQKEVPDQYPSAQAVDEHIKLMEPGGNIISSPEDIAVVEQIREEAARSCEFGPAIPTDVFVWAKGEPPRPEVTKIGGLPYWPANQEWPRNSSNAPLTFIAQFCLTDSRDIIDDPPCDVLLLFADFETFWDEDPNSLIFAQVDIGDGEQIRAQDVPKTEWEIAPLYGHIHRTFDFPESANCFEAYGRPWRLDILEGTKIGGLPHWVQDEEDLPGRFLCALGPSAPSSDVAYPWINIAQPIGFGDPFYDLNLGFGDAGSLYVFEENGSFAWTMQGY